MNTERTIEALKTGDIQWNLTCFYTGISDLQIDKDVKSCIQKAKQFKKRFKGKLATKLGDAITAYSKLEELQNKIFGYLSLLISLDSADETVKTKMDSCEKKLRIALSDHLTFFNYEIIRLPEKNIKEQAIQNKTVAFHMPWIQDMRAQKPHLLSERVEGALSKRSMFGASSWHQFYNEIEAGLRFNFDGKELTENEILIILNEDRNAARRAEALEVFNKCLGEKLAKLSAQTLNIIIGAQQIEDMERNYRHPMSERNEDNGVSDAAVNALHKTVLKIGAPIARRYYELKGRHLNIRPLAWSDRNAPIPFTNNETIPYPEAIKIVAEAYESFSTVLANIIRHMILDERIDASAKANRNPGAFNMSLVLPGNVPACFTFLNYLGTERDVMVLAHELGHSAHGILAGATHGVLMQHASTVLAETASIFGEMTTFNFLKKRALEKGDKKKLIALNMEKLSDFINTVIRQISFSNFERYVHGAKNRLSVPELNNIWMQVTKELYGKDGEIFSYKNCEYLWAHIPHFHEPFYVYGYAFGELLTQSLYAIQGNFEKKEFESLYLNMLRSGNTKYPQELLTPFKLDLTNQQFWVRGFKTAENLLDETEELSMELGV